jgi:phosphosulfolactate phosphohydrolase-like enzyme
LNVRILAGVASAKDATGHAVIIDVFRAFTTAAFCIAAGATEVVLLKKPVPAGAKVAVTLEPESGSNQPTGRILMGTDTA